MTYMLRALLFGVLTQTSVAVKFCANKYLPSGSCPENAQEICDAVNDGFCRKVGLHYSVAGVPGCSGFQSGTRAGECYNIFELLNLQNPDNVIFPSCNPTARTYCECTTCTQDSDCDLWSVGGESMTCNGEQAEVALNKVSGAALLGELASRQAC